MTREPLSISDHAEAVWCQLLNVPAVGRDDDFFDLGGDSMLAIKMLLDILGEAGAHIDFERYFERPTLGQLLAMIEEERDQRS